MRMTALLGAAAIVIGVIPAEAMIAAAHADDRLAATAARTAVYGNTERYTPTIFEVYPTNRPCWSPINVTSRFAPLLAKLASVPIPCYLTPSEGTDGEAVIIDTTNGTTRLFEGWRLNFTSVWNLDWGGYEAESAFNKTAYGWVWPVHESTYGVQASGFSFVPGLITVRDLHRGRIDHAIHIAVPRSCNTWVAPATRTDGNAAATGTEDCYQYGMAYKLPADFVIPRHWPNVVKLIAAAARDHGLVITDQTWYGIGIRFENYRRPWAWWSRDGSIVDPYRDPYQPQLNLFECAKPANWHCYPDQNNLFAGLSRVEAPNRASFWQALVRVN